MKLHEFQEQLRHDKALSKLDARIKRQVDAYLANQAALPESQRVSDNGMTRAVKGIMDANLARFERNQKRMRS